MEQSTFISVPLFFNQEKREGCGEDSILGVLDGPNAVLIATMDGCGGAGAQRYKKADNRSGARIASEHVGTALRRWFQNNYYGYCGTAGKTADALAGEMKAEISKELRLQYELVEGESSGVISRRARTFPTTLTAILLEAVGRNQIRCISFWAGDSRTFLFRATGLQQTSRDDVRGDADPFESLLNDDVHSNLVSFDRDFGIRTSETILTEPCIAMTASDGCFSYFQSPMALEWILLDTLKESTSPQMWEECLRTVLGSYAQDDHTMNITVIGFANWTAVKNAYAPRWIQFKETYWEPLQKILAEENLQTHHELWLQYKKEYMPAEGGNA